MTDRRYPAAREFAQITQLTGIDPARVVRRARLPAGFIGGPARGVSAEVYFRLWTALIEEMNDPQAPLIIAHLLAENEMIAHSRYALIHSPNLVTALDRLSVFKEVAGPFRIKVARGETEMVVTLEPGDPKVDIPVSFYVTYFGWVLHLSQKVSGQKARALWTRLPVVLHDLPAEYGPVQAGAPALALSPEDALRPNPNRDEAIWTLSEATLARDLAAPLSAGVRAILRELLPTGEFRASAVAAELSLSQRTFQRQLAAEGTTYQALLDAVRTEMAQDYLRDPDLATEEIAYLLAFRDSSSFFRAFHGWTGKTPGQMRKSA